MSQTVTCNVARSGRKNWERLGQPTYETGTFYDDNDVSGFCRTVSLEPLAHDVLNARAVNFGSTLADHYDPKLIPPNLGRVHWAFDWAVDRLY